MMKFTSEEVNPSKRGGMDGVFRGLAKAAPRDFPRAKPEGNPEEQPMA